MIETEEQACKKQRKEESAVVPEETSGKETKGNDPALHNIKYIIEYSYVENVIHFRMNNFQKNFIKNTN